MSSLCLLFPDLDLLPTGVLDLGHLKNCRYSRLQPSPDFLHHNLWWWSPGLSVLQIHPRLLSQPTWAPGLTGCGRFSPILSACSSPQCHLRLHQPHPHSMLQVDPWFGEAHCTSLHCWVFVLPVRSVLPAANSSYKKPCCQNKGPCKFVIPST